MKCNEEVLVLSPTVMMTVISAAVQKSAAIVTFRTDLFCSFLFIYFLMLRLFIFQ